MTNRCFMKASCDDEVEKRVNDKELRTVIRNRGAIDSASKTASNRDGILARNWLKTDQIRQTDKRRDAVGQRWTWGRRPSTVCRMTSNALRRTVLRLTVRLLCAQRRQNSTCANHGANERATISPRRCLHARRWIAINRISTVVHPSSCARSPQQLAIPRRLLSGLTSPSLTSLADKNHSRRTKERR